MYGELRLPQAVPTSSSTPTRQVFLQEGDTTTFVGDFDAINELVESNKDLGTFDQAFAGVEKDE